MLRECVEYLLTPCTKPARKLGYLRESIAISARGRRQTTAWQPHLEQCRSLIVESASDAKRGGVAWVLGSGALLDIPLEVLAERFSRVFLVDTIHPLGCRYQLDNYPNVKKITADLTGLTGLLLRLKTGDPLPEPIFPILPIPQADFIVSANLLAQLPLLPKSFLRRKRYSESALDVFCERILQSHLQFLHAQKSPVCLITETTRHYKNVTSGITESTTALHRLQLPTPDKQWQWDIAPCYEIDADTVAWFEIAGYQRFGKG